MTELSFQFVPQPDRDGSDFPPKKPTLIEGEYTISAPGVRILDCEGGRLHVTDSGSIRYKTQSSSITESALNKTYAEAVQAVADLLHVPPIQYSISLIVSNEETVELSVDSEETIECFGKNELDVDEFGYTDLHGKAVRVSFRTGERATLA